MLMALAARWDLEIRQLDAVNAFLNSKLDEEVYVELPDGFKLLGKVGRLLRALYGLRRSSLLW
jgi:Reverse transcriptase (RNA-dependent DNA polymerase)